MAETTNPLEEEDFQQLQVTISPVSDSERHSIDLFVHTLEFVDQKLT